MDETEATAQDNTPSGGNEGSTSEAKPDTFTEEQVVERERKVKSDVLAEMGRAKKLNADLIKSSQAIQDRLNERDKEEVEREREKHQGDPGQLSAIDEKVKRRTAESELSSTKLKLEEANERLQTADAEKAETTKERNAREIATRLNVDAKLLAELAKLTDGSTGAIEEKAKLLPKKGETKTIKPDSSKTTGISQMPDSSGAKIKLGWDKIHPQG